MLIGLDWGSTRLRAMRLGPRGVVLEERSSPQGASTLTGGASAFINTLDALIGDWDPDLPLLACGMVGSRHGWREVPYANCPADAAALAAGMQAVHWHARTVHLVPGLLCQSQAGTPELMRGEETQAFGALALAPALSVRATLLMPGTHSKWVSMRDGRVHDFATHMTGELYALLRQHSVLARLMPVADGHGPGHDDAFVTGVTAARNHGHLGLPHQIFAVRSLGLQGGMDTDALPDYLSGLLIGHELRAGLGWVEEHDLSNAPLRLIGDMALCERYLRALRVFGLGEAQVMPNCTAAGLWSLACQGILG